MTVKVGDKVPSAKVRQMTSDGAKDINPAELFANKKVVLFALPGAFTPTCSAKHLPGFRDKAAELKKKGVDLVACLSVNDAFVMDAWGKDRGVGDKIKMLADGNAEYTKALGLELDASKNGLGTRSKRFSIIVDNGVAKKVNVDEGKYELTSAEATCHLN